MSKKIVTVSLGEICRYTKASVDTRNMVEGQQVINSGFIIMCGATHITKFEIKLNSLVLKTSELKSKEPHCIQGILKICANKEVQIKQMSCSCKAGKSESCKHIVAVLLYCNR